MKRLMIAGILMIPSFASADMSYSYVEAGVEFGNLDIAGTEYDATEVSGEISYAAHKNVALLVSASSMDVDLPSPFELSGSGFGFAALGHLPINEVVDFELGLGLQSVKLKASNGVVTAKDDDTATGVLLGIRGAVTDGIEAEARIVSTDAFDERSESYSLLARLAFNKTVSGSVGYAWGDDYSGMQLALRVNY